MDDGNEEAAFAGEWRHSERIRWRVLDPAGEPRGTANPASFPREELPYTVYSTVYVADELIVRPSLKSDDSDEIVDVPTRIDDLRTIANRAGWDLQETDLEDGREPVSATASRRALLTVAPTSATSVTAQTPDAWEVLRQARRDGVDGGVSLNHVISTDSLGLNPFKANPFKANPFKANPFKANPFKANAAGVGIDSYGAVGFGGRQPVTYLGPQPVYDPHGPHPVVAVFDTGLGEHPWFAGAVRLPPNTKYGPIGIVDQKTDPEVHPSLDLPLDGIFDDASGHGTFIAGIVRQQCPQARILAVRVADGDGLILETELIGALGRLIDYLEEGGTVDVLNLSFSFYHETPDDPKAISDIADLLRRLREDWRVVVVCSAGNEASDRPTFPAALPGSGVQHLSVGALNPANHSVALFSNIGTWVDVYAPGVSVVSTVPLAFDGGVQAGTSDAKYGRRRETLDVDDFRQGFGVWSGTSFAAPVAAARIAGRIGDGADPKDAVKAVVKELKEGDLSRPT
jgi:hypothetical protein